MKRRVTFILLTALVSIFGTMACGGGAGLEQQGVGQQQEDLEQRVGQLEQTVQQQQEEMQVLEDQVQEKQQVEGFFGPQPGQDEEGFGGDEQQNGGQYVR